MLQSLLRLGSHRYDLNVSALRHRTFTVAAAVMLVSPAFAQSPTPTPTPVASQSIQIDANTNCRERITANELLGDIKCEITKGKLLDAQGRALDGQLSAQKENLACMQKIKPFVASGKVSRDVLLQYGSSRMCELLKTLG